MAKVEKKKGGAPGKKRAKGSTRKAKGLGAKVMEEIRNISAAVTEGNLDVRANLEGLTGDGLEALTGVNQMLDTIHNEGKAWLGHLNNIPTPVVAMDKEFSISFINEAGAGALGKTREECIGAKCYDLFNTPDCNTENCQCAKAMKMDGVFTGDTVANLPSGELPIRYTGAPLKNENGEIIGALEFVLDISKELEVTNGIAELVEAAVEGQLATRADTSKFEGNYRKIVQGVNDTLDAVIAPLNVAAEYIDRISKGDIPELITDEYRGDFNEIKNNLNVCINAINALVEEADNLANAAVEGFLDNRADAEKHQGDFQKIVKGINAMLGSVVGHLDAIPAPAMIIGKDFNIRYMNESGSDVCGKTKAELVGQKCYDQFKTSDCKTDKCACAQAMAKGSKADSETDAHPQGMDLEIAYSAVPIKDAVGDIIGALEIVIDQTEAKKLAKDAAEKVDYLNNIPTPVMVVDKELNVQFMNPAGANAVGRTPEACIDQKCFNLFNTDHCNTADCQVAKAMREDAVCTNDTIAKLPSGDLPIRYSGAPLKNEKGEIIGALEYVLDITDEMAVTNGIGELAQAALEGDLSRRADLDKYDGNYQKIAKNVNDTINAIVEPITEAAEALATLANKDLRARIVGDYKGDHAKIKDSLNTAAGAAG